MQDLVPTIDVSGADDPIARGRIASAIDDALTLVGFMQIVGHGIDPEALAAVLEATDEFFARPLAEKCAVEPPAAHINRGYSAPGSESLSYSIGRESKPDVFEAFNVGPEDVDLDDPRFAGELEGAFAANLWPAEPPSLRAAVEAYFVEARACAHRLTDLFADALGVAPDTFRSITQHSTDMLRMINYQRAGDIPAETEGQLRMGAHTDYGLVTVLYADPVEGLEIMGPDGQWHGFIPAPGAILVNIGDLLAEMTNDRWRSTIHRVVPPRAEGVVRRRSMAFFHDGDFDALISVLPECCDEANPPKYEPVLAGDHLREKILAPRALVVSTSGLTVGDRLD